MADVNLSTHSSGNNALDIAQQTGNQQMINLLTSYEKQVNLEETKVVSEVNNLINNSKESKLEPQEIYGKLFTALMESGYYDPTEDYAEKNTKLLENLSQGEFKGIFCFRLKTYNLLSTLNIDSNSTMIRVTTFISGLLGSKEIKELFIKLLSKNIACPILSIDDDEDIKCEYYLFTPYNAEQLITVLNWFDDVIKLFVQQYPEAVKQLQEDK